MGECELYTFTRQSKPFCLLLSKNSEYLQQEVSNEYLGEVQEVKTRSWSAEPRLSSVPTCFGTETHYNNILDHVESLMSDLASAQFISYSVKDKA